MPTRSRSRLPRWLLLAALALFAGAAPLHAQRASAPRPLVVIDPGHGGVDPGARGPGGVREKEVTLAVAREVARLLREEGGVEVRLTRDRDTLVALRDRWRLANQWRSAVGRERPALFLSLHANAHAERSANGFETYFLSEALTADARRVAERENAAQKYEKQSTASDELGFILNDLRRTHYLRESSEWAEVIQRRLRSVHPGPDRGVKQAGFVVLDGAFMPAVLVEMGFITNPREERMLAERDAQRRIARELARAVREYLAGSAPAAGAK